MEKLKEKCILECEYQKEGQCTYNSETAQFPSNYKCPKNT